MENKFYFMLQLILCLLCRKKKKLRIFNEKGYLIKLLEEERNFKQ